MPVFSHCVHLNSGCLWQCRRHPRRAGHFSAYACYSCCTYIVSTVTVTVTTPSRSLSTTSTSVRLSSRRTRQVTVTVTRPRGEPQAEALTLGSLALAYDLQVYNAVRPWGAIRSPWPPPWAPPAALSSVQQLKYHYAGCRNQQSAARLPRCGLVPTPSRTRRNLKLPVCPSHHHDDIQLQYLQVEWGTT